MKYTYIFSKNKTDGKKELKELLGGKGANLAEMALLGIPIPPGFTITTEVCELFYKNNKELPNEVKQEIKERVKELEEITGKKFGDNKNPLLVSVRSGAAISMPGMMDTVLNLGLNDETVEALAKLSNNQRFAYDSYRRFIQMFGNVVLGINSKEFEDQLEAIKKQKQVKYDIDLNVDDLKELVSRFKNIIKEKGLSFPQEPIEQLMLAANAVFNSWNNERAIYYRKINNIKGLIGTAVNVQTMVFGNLNNDSGTGVCFSRNPSTGKKEFYGEYLLNAQGEDVVAGIRTPKPLDELKKEMPEIYSELTEIKDKLEQHYKDMQDMEFTIENRKLFLLQTRTGKRTINAAINIAADMLDEGLIDEKTAILRINPEQIEKVLHPQLSQEAKNKAKLIVKGLPASPGAAYGRVVFDSESAVEEAKKGPIILVRNETSPEDLIGMDAAKGILTAKGGMTSHAAVVARGMGKCCIAGSGIDVNEEKKEFSFNEIIVKENDFITLDGSTGEVFIGKLSVEEAKLSTNFERLLKIAIKYKRLEVRTNADTPKDAKKALDFYAEGIGLCRTEHMFFEDNKINAIREMILSDTKEQRKKALDKVLDYQKQDFLEIMKIMNNKEVTIRLLDPPLHEFIPKEEDAKKEIAEKLGISLNEIEEKIQKLEEVNPMMGIRGCRLGIMFPEITEMQVKAIILAAIELKKQGINAKPEIMVPLVNNSKEFENQKQLIKETADKLLSETNTVIDYKIGTMIETPRAALTAKDLSESEFFSFGTNDLTQMTFGFSRDDVAPIIQKYIQKGILKQDPFQVLDKQGVGKLMSMAVKDIKNMSNKKIGICGEHGGNPESIMFAEEIGLDYVSCSPYRVPVAIFASAHANLKQK